MSDIENYDDMEELDLDLSMGEVKEDLYWCEITKAEVKKNMENGKVSIRVGLEVCDGPYAGVKATDIIGTDTTKMFNAKKLRNFLESVLGKKLGESVRIKLDRDVEGKPTVAGAVGERVGAYLKSSEEGYINVTMKGYVVYSPDSATGEEPF